MSKLNKIIGDLSELNHLPGTFDSDEITIDLHDGLLYIYPRYELWKGVIFRLDEITKVLSRNRASFYLSDTKYDNPCIVVTVY